MTSVVPAAGNTGGVRRAGSPAGRAWRAWPVAVIALAALLSACSGGGTGDGGVAATFRFDPQPPSVGKAHFELRLVSPQGEAVAGATVAVEANMNHAGMQPTFADLSEDVPGRYVGDVEFTMGGDWFLLMNATLADGRKIERKLDVPGVRSK
ncbi:MAG: FixH family protein [Planctomycetes bacterium]|nr:FixH family protein [Planctomycetota bacterium]